MKTSLKTLASTALLATVVGGLPSNAKAIGFMPLGEGALPSGTLLQDLQVTINPGESIPWHYHPGPVYVVIVSGTITEDTGCGQPVVAHGVGSAFFEETGKVHQVFNYGTVPVVIIVTFIVPPAYADYTGQISVDGPRCEGKSGRSHLESPP